MTVDRLGQQSSGFMGALPKRSLAADSARATSDALTSGSAGIGFSGASGQTANASNHLLQTWGDKSYIWGTREAMAEAVNWATRGGKAQVADEFGFGSTGAKETQGLGQASQSYAALFKLGDKTMDVRNFNWEGFKNLVSENTQRFRDTLKGTSGEKFFSDTTARSYFKNTVVENNIKPIKDLFSDNPDKQIGSGVFRLFGFGLMAADIMHHTRNKYNEMKSQEDGSLGSKIHTLFETAKTMGKYTLRSAASWEIGGLAFAAGRALIPLSIGGVALPGILIGALAGAVVQEKVLNPLLGIDAKEDFTRFGKREGTADNPFRQAIS